jgi:hypothetical protein
MADEKAIAGYLEKFKQLKERNSVKEIMDREMLLEFINLNHERIAEFPLLETEQLGVINILTKRASEHPSHEQLRQWISDFLLSLNKYSKAAATQDKDGLAENKTPLINAESILVQCIQGAVFATGLIKDNLAHSIIRHFGPESLEKIRHTQENVEFDERFWRAYVDAFAMEPVKNAYASIVAAKKFQLSKEDQTLAIRFQFDDVLAMLPSVEADIKKTRIQTMFEQAQNDQAAQRTKELIIEKLRSDRKSTLKQDFFPQELAHAALIACMDPIGEAFYKAFGPKTPSAGASQEQSDSSEDPVARTDFIWRQVQAMVLGAALAMAIVRNDFLKSLKEFSAPEIKAVDESMGSFEIQQAETALLMILELHFALALKERGVEEGGKLLVRQNRYRRVPAEAIRRLYDKGFNRIRQKKMFDEDPANPEMLLFKTRTSHEFIQLVKVFQIEPALENRLKVLWRDASFKVEFFVLLNLAQLAKVTTNLSQRLAEILAKYELPLR